jgi:hypothetical protein
MSFTMIFTMKRVVLGGLCAGALAAAGCADGPATPTSASASAPAASSAALASSPRSGELHIQKGCPPPGFTGQANDFCTITSSNIKAIEVGSRVVYASALDNGVLDSDVTLVVGPGNTAFGHCELDVATSAGLCTFSGGTGKFTHFQATANVSHVGGVIWAWDGTYSFSPHD